MHWYTALAIVVSAVAVLAHTYALRTGLRRLKAEHEEQRRKLDEERTGDEWKECDVW